MEACHARTPKVWYVPDWIPSLTLTQILFLEEGQT